jgi:hypothetical protein
MKSLKGFAGVAALTAVLVTSPGFTTETAQSTSSTASVVNVSVASGGRLG